MAKKAGNAARVSVNELAVSGFINSTTMNVTQEELVVTCLSDAGPRRLPGNYDHNLSNAGYIDTADDSYDERMHALLQSLTDMYVGYRPEGDTEGSVAYEQVDQPTAMPRTAAVGQAILLDVQAAGSGHLARGVVLRSATVTGTGTGTGQNVGATSANTILVATFRLISGTFTSITMDIQQSSDNGSGDAYADIAGMTSGSMTAVGVVRTTTTAATEAWKRVEVAAFSGTNAVMLVTLTVEASTG